MRGAACTQAGACAPPCPPPCSSGKDIIEVVPASSPLPATSLAALEVAPQLPRSFVPQPGFKLTSTYSIKPDFPSFHTSGGQTWLLNHFESPQPATWYVSRLSSNSEGGLRIMETQAVPDGEVRGATAPRRDAGGRAPPAAGSQTPAWLRGCGQRVAPCSTCFRFLLSPQVKGLWHTQSGSRTPWGTHLSAEKFPPDW